MTPDDLKTWAEIAQAVITSLGILVAGAWSFYVFVLGRSTAPNIQIHFEVKRTTKLEQFPMVVVSTTVKNVGRTRAQKEDCWITAAPITAKIESSHLSRLDTPLQFSLSHAKVYSIFDDHAWLEPGEEAKEDVMFVVSESPMFKVGVIFIGHNKRWTSSAILDARQAKKESSGLATEKDQEIPSSFWGE